MACCGNYPGSPRIARDSSGRTTPAVVRAARHRRPVLAQQFAQAQPPRGGDAGDGFAGLKAVLPPPSRRGLVLIDPSYELASDYRAVATAVRDAFAEVRDRHLRRVVSAARNGATHGSCPTGLGRAARYGLGGHCADGEGACVRGVGLHGSGMFIVNPPWKFTDYARDHALAHEGACAGRDRGIPYSTSARRSGRFEHRPTRRSEPVKMDAARTCSYADDARDPLLTRLCRSCPPARRRRRRAASARSASRTWSEETAASRPSLPRARARGRR